MYRVMVVRERRFGGNRQSDLVMHRVVPTAADAAATLYAMFGTRPNMEPDMIDQRVRESGVFVYVHGIRRAIVIEAKEWA